MIIAGTSSATGLAQVDLSSQKENESSSWKKGVIFLLIILIFQELVFRFLFPLPESQVFNRRLYMPSIGGDKSKNAIRSINVIWHSDPDSAHFQTTLNRYGFRGDTWSLAPTPGRRRVAFIGDSFTEGLMAADDETIPVGFAKAAKAAGEDVEALNFGVGGLEPEQYLLLLLDSVSLFRPKDVVVVVFANDLGKEDVPKLRLPVPVAPFPWWKPRIWQLVEMLKKSECIPARWNFISRPFFYPIGHPANPLTERVKRNKSKVSPMIYEAMAKGRFAPMRVGGSVYLEKQLREPFDLTDTLSEIKKFCAVYGTNLHFVYLPDRAMVTNHYKQYEHVYSSKEDLAVDLTKDLYHLHRRLLAEQCKKQKIPFLDLTPFVRSEEQAGHHLYWKYDDHLRGEAYLKIGRKIYEWVKTLSR